MVPVLFSKSAESVVLNLFVIRPVQLRAVQVYFPAFP